MSLLPGDLWGGSGSLGSSASRPRQTTGAEEREGELRDVIAALGRALATVRTREIRSTGRSVHRGRPEGRSTFGLARQKRLKSVAAGLQFLPRNATVCKGATSNYRELGTQRRSS